MMKGHPRSCVSSCQARYVALLRGSGPLQPPSQYTACRPVAKWSQRFEDSPISNRAAICAIPLPKLLNIDLALGGSFEGAIQGVGDLLQRGYRVNMIGKRGQFLHQGRR